jgi:hypothetical protein
LLLGAELKGNALMGGLLYGSKSMQSSAQEDFPTLNASVATDE